MLVYFFKYFKYVFYIYIYTVRCFLCVNECISSFPLFSAALVNHEYANINVGAGWVGNWLNIFPTTKLSSYMQMWKSE